MPPDPPPVVLRGRKGKNSTEQLVARLSADAAKRRELLAAGTTVHLYDMNAPGTRATRLRTREEFREVMKSILVGEQILPPDVTDDELDRHCFTRDRITEYTCTFIAAIASDPQTSRGRLEERFKIGSLEKRVDALWWFTTWELGIDAAALYSSWTLRTSSMMHKMALENNLGTTSRDKPYFGVRELRLLASTVFNECRQTVWYKQQLVLWTMACITGVRIGSMAQPREYKGQYLKWKHVRFFRHGQQGIFLEITYHFMKGYRDPYSDRARSFKPAKFLIQPCENAFNLHVDLTWMLLCLAVDRGLFTGNVQELETCEHSELPQDPVIAELPVFVAGNPGNVLKLTDKPMSATNASGPLKVITRKSGLTVANVSMYSFRREFITIIGRVEGKDAAKEWAGHIDRREAYRHYDYGHGDKNVTSRVLGEGEFASTGQDRNRMRAILVSAAINQRVDEANESKRKEYIANMVGAAGPVVEFDTVLEQICGNFIARFDLDCPCKVVPIKRALHSPDSTAVYALPSGFRSEDANSWMQHCLGLSRRADASAFLDAFCKYRKAQRRWIAWQYAKAFDDHVNRNVQKPTLKVREQRLAESRTPLILPSGGRKTEPPSLPSTREGPSRDLSDIMITPWDGTVTPSRNIPSDADLASITDDEGSMGESDEDDEDDICEPPIPDLFEVLGEGNTLKATIPGEESRGPSNSTAMTTSSIYRETKQSLIDAWNNCKDFVGKNQTCLSCLGRVSHTPDHVKFLDAHKLDRHLLGRDTIHDNEVRPVSEYTRWCFKDGAYHCHHCPSKVQTAESLARHLKTKHKEFVHRLQR